MPLKLTKIEYSRLNARQKENFNFAKVSAVLADYGYVTMRLSSDWQGADFIAQHVDGNFLKVQLKGRLDFREKYRGKDLHVAFFQKGDWYLYPHDELLKRVLSETTLGDTVSWRKGGGYSFPHLGKKMLALLAPYKIRGSTSAIG